MSQKLSKKVTVFKLISTFKKSVPKYRSLMLAMNHTPWCASVHQSLGDSSTDEHWQKINKSIKSSESYSTETGKKMKKVKAWQVYQLKI